MFGSAIGLLAFPRLARRWGRRMRPCDWARLSVLALIAGAAGLEVSLALIGLPTALKAFGVSGLVVACRRVFGELAPGGSIVGWSAAVSAALLPLATTVAWRRAAATAAGMQVESWLGEHKARGDVKVVLLPTDATIAYCVARPTQQVVLSQGLRDRLVPDHLEAVVRHELSHLRHRHATLLVAANAAVRVLPVLRPSTKSLRDAFERWADEDAAASGPRARAAVHDALARVAATLAVEPVVAAFANVDTLVDRLDALAAAPPVPSFAGWFSTHAALGGAAAVAAPALGAWVVEARMMASLVGFCRM